MATIAIIDNDLDNRDVLQALLQGKGYSADTFSSGKEFLSRFKPKQFRLILMDLGMPDMDGYELLKIVRSQDPSVPVMAVTARAMTVDRANAQAAGFSDFVTKPYTDLSAFYGLIVKYLGPPTD